MNDQQPDGLLPAGGGEPKPDVFGTPNLAARAKAAAHEAGKQLAREFGTLTRSERVRNRPRVSI